jgi:hypothetical protein
MWVYEQATGAFLHGDSLSAMGYSGFGPGKNDPLQQHLPGLGPIPQGAYLIGAETDTPDHGPVVMHLVPLTGTQTFERSGFLIHGDSKEHPGAASHGCIILPRNVREYVAGSTDRLLIVLSGRRPQSCSP